MLPKWQKHWILRILTIIWKNLSINIRMKKNLCVPAACLQMKIIGFVDAYTYFKVQGIDIDKLDSADIAVQDKLSKVYGEETYADLMLFDSIIANQDRHYGNFGYLIDNNTGKYIKPAPIFDNGLSLTLYGSTARCN